MLKQLAVALSSALALLFVALLAAASTSPPEMQSLRAAAGGGDAEAQNKLGLVYERGVLVAQDLAEAVRWFRKAADQGNAYAQNNLGSLHERGAGVAQDYTLALMWYRKAAGQGHAVAQQNLAAVLPRAIRQELATLGYEPGPVEGGVTRRLETAIRAFQSDAGLLADDAISEALFDDIQQYKAVRVGFSRLMEHGSGIIGMPQYLQETSRSIRGAGACADSTSSVNTAHCPDSVAVILSARDPRAPDGSLAGVARRNAQSVREFLVHTLRYPVTNVTLVLDSTLADFSRLFGAAGDSGPSGGGAREVFVYYSGSTTLDPKTGAVGFVPTCGEGGEAADQGFPLERLWAHLGRVNVRNVVLVLETSFPKGPDAEASPIRGNAVAYDAGIRLGAPADAVVIVAAAPGQRNAGYPDQGRSVFTHLWMQGVSGAADADEDRTVTVGELRTYLVETVSSEARRLTGMEQTPIVIGDSSRVLSRVE